MSQFMPEKREGESQSGKPKWPPEKGPEEFLTNDERAFMRRFLGHPEDFPPEFGSYLQDFMAVNIPQVPISQIVGFSQFTATVSIIAAAEATTSTTYVDLSTLGPQISGLSDGKYVFFLSCQVVKGTVSDGGLAALSFNGSAPVDADGVILSDTSNIAQNTTVSRPLVRDLDGGGNNVVKMQYRTINGNSITFGNRSLVALRYGN